MLATRHRVLRTARRYDASMQQQWVNAAASTLASETDGELPDGCRSEALPPVAVVILAAEKDMSGLDVCVRGILAHCLNPVTTVQVIAQRRPRRLPGGIDSRVVWCPEHRCTVSSQAVRAYLRALGRDSSTASWYFQQLAKLLCFAVLPVDAPQHILVVDADFVFLMDTAFVDNRGRSVLPYGYPLSWHPGPSDAHRLPARHSALEAAGRLVPGWVPVDAYSGMQHHIVFDRDILNALLQQAEDAHGMPFWQAFLRTADPGKWTGASEYVLYRHFAARFYPGRVRHRHVDAVDVIQGEGPGGFILPEVAAAAQGSSLRAVGCHRFLYYTERLATMDYIPAALRRTLGPVPGPLRLRLEDGTLTIGQAVRPLTLV
ncbi:hypothetical protein [Streptomyces sp. NPDC006610]|uniref:hypothetical protein n=1 Tax=Streptomyces sp. NPDC006610 TaxID=3154584 RepID=UPI0033A54486